MSLLNWLRSRKRFSSPATRSAQQRKAPTTRLHLEALEDRTLPSVTLGSAFNIGPPPGQAGSSWGRDVTTDSTGNVYITGEFNGTIDCDPNDTTHTNSAAILHSNADGIFVVKYTPSSTAASGVTFDWANYLGARTTQTNTEWGEALAVDSSANVFLTGVNDANAAFGSYTAPSTGTFVAKLNGSNGSVLNVQFTPETNIPNDFSQDIALDAQGHVDVLNGGTVEQLSANTLQSLWTHTFNATGHGLTTDKNGNVYATGEFRGNATFGGTTLNSGGRSVSPNAAAFVTKLDSNGNVLWADAFAGSSSQGTGASGYDIAVDTNGNVYTTGTYSGTVDFNPASGHNAVIDLTSSNGSDVYVSKLDANGKYVWAKSMSGTDNQQAYGIALDSAGNVWTTGYFYGTASFGAYNLTSGGSRDIFVAELDANGNVLWAGSMGGTGSDQGQAIAVDSTGVYVTGLTNGDAFLETLT
jgi:hypothetical protein